MITVHFHRSEIFALILVHWWCWSETTLVVCEMQQRLKWIFINDAVTSSYNFNEAFSKDSNVSKQRKWASWRKAFIVVFLSISFLFACVRVQLWTLKLNTVQKPDVKSMNGKNIKFITKLVHWLRLIIVYWVVTKTLKYISYELAVDVNGLIIIENSLFVFNGGHCA